MNGRVRAIDVLTGAALLLLAVVLIVMEVARLSAKELRAASAGDDFLPETRFLPRRPL